MRFTRDREERSCLLSIYQLSLLVRRDHRSSGYVRVQALCVDRAAQLNPLLVCLSRLMCNVQPDPETITLGVL